MPEPSLDSWTSLFLLAAATGLYLFVLLLLNRNQKTLPIAFLILAFSLILFQYVLYWTNYTSHFPYFNLIPPFCYYLTGPLVYLYISHLYGIKIKTIFHFLIGASVLLSNFILWLNYLDLTKWDVPFKILWGSPWLIFAHMLLYLLLSLREPKTNDQKQSEYLHLRYRWCKILLSLYGLFILSYLSYYVLVMFPFFNEQWDYMISIVMSASIYTIGYFVFKEPQIFNGELHAHLFFPKSRSKESLEEALLNDFFNKVTKHMKEKKPFTNNELRLVHLADQLGFSTHLLSKVINKKSGKNFNNFVNDYRLIEAEDMLKNSSANSIKSIYFDVGFNSKATFYKAFKKKHNCSPSEFIQKNTYGD
ncbi:MAG: helix-turn-helix domain-containing protein [Bacteroidota bacterium]